MTACRATPGDPVALVRDRSLDGLELRRFACLPGCGECCRYKVSLLAEDITRIERAGYRASGFLDLSRPPADGFDGCLAREAGRCVFLDDELRCRVYADRPLYCRLYPYIRESYLETQLDVDLSCPGVGRGARLSDEVLRRILLRDGSPAAQDRIIALRRAGARRAERLLSSRARLEPFPEIVERAHELAAGGLVPMLGRMRELSSPAVRQMLPFAPPLGEARPDASGEKLLRDYLLIWSERQALWRWTDAFLCVTPVARSRAETFFAFLVGIADAVVSEASAGAGDASLGRGDVLRAIRRRDGSCRTYCQAYRLEGPVRS